MGIGSHGAGDRLWRFTVIHVPDKQLSYARVNAFKHDRGAIGRDSNQGNTSGIRNRISMEIRDATPYFLNAARIISRDALF